MAHAPECQTVLKEKRLVPGTFEKQPQSNLGVKMHSALNLLISC